jgi:cytochrome P450
MYDLFGDSILLSGSDENWNQRRKHLSAAFYKEKMAKMLNMIIDLTHDKVEEWKRDYAGTDKSIPLVKGTTDLLTECL